MTAGLLWVGSCFIGMACVSNVIVVVNFFCW